MPQVVLTCGFLYYGSFMASQIITWEIKIVLNLLARRFIYTTGSRARGFLFLKIKLGSSEVDKDEEHKIYLELHGRQKITIYRGNNLCCPGDSYFYH